MKSKVFKLNTGAFLKLNEEAVVKNRILKLYYKYFIKVHTVDIKCSHVLNFWARPVYRTFEVFIQNVDICHDAVTTSMRFFGCLSFEF